MVNLEEGTYELRTARVDLRKICELVREVDEQFLDTIKFSLELDCVPHRKLSRVPLVMTFSLRERQADGLVLGSSNTTERLPQLHATPTALPVPKQLPKHFPTI